MATIALSGTGTDKKVVLKTIDGVQKASCSCCGYASVGLMWVATSKQCNFCGDVDPDGDPCIAYTYTTITRHGGIETRNNCTMESVCTGPGFYETIELHRGTIAEEGSYVSIKYIKYFVYNEDCTDNTTFEYLYGTDNWIDTENGDSCSSTMDSNGIWSGTDNGEAIDQRCSQIYSPEIGYDCCDAVQDPEYFDDIITYSGVVTDCVDPNGNDTFPVYFTPNELGYLGQCNGSAITPIPNLNRGITGASAYNLGSALTKNIKTTKYKLFHPAFTYLKVTVTIRTRTYTQTSCSAEWSYPVTSETTTTFDYIYENQSGVANNNCSDLVISQEFSLNTMNGQDAIVFISGYTTVNPNE
jgi:hypothetical protein